MTDLAEHKRQLREQMKAHRAQHHAGFPHAANALRDRALEILGSHKPAVVAAYLAFGSELDPAPLIEALRAKGHSIALPAVVAKNEPLRFHRHEPGDKTTLSSFGAPEPLPTAAIITPDILLVPMLAFDKQRYRLGYGGGFYDRTLAHLRNRKKILAIGVAYSFQEVDAVPRHAHDAQLDKIVTEIQAFD